MTTKRIFIGPMFKKNEDGVLERIGVFGDDLLTQAAGYSAVSDETNYIPKMSDIADRIVSFLEKNDTTMYTTSMELVETVINLGKKDIIGFWNNVENKFNDVEI